MTHTALLLIFMLCAVLFPFIKIKSAKALHHNIYYPKQNTTKMISISVNYNCKWQVKGMTEYKFAKKKLFNCKRGKEVKKVLNGYSVGYNLRGKFYSLSRIKEMIEPAEEISSPF